MHAVKCTPVHVCRAEGFCQTLLSKALMQQPSGHARQQQEALKIAAPDECLLEGCIRFAVLQGMLPRSVHGCSTIGR